MNRRQLIAGAAALAASTAITVPLVAAARPDNFGLEFLALLDRLSPDQKREYASIIRAQQPFRDAPGKIGETFRDLADIIERWAARQEALQSSR